MGGRPLNLARILPRSAVNGPGERFVAWAQGCSLRCAGCWNPDTWGSGPREVVFPEQLAAQILATPDIEGVTLTGGEPFDQADAFAVVAALVRAGGLSVMAFTGYELDELTTPAQRRLVDLCDVVVAGRYRRELRDLALVWRGSSNQRVHSLTERYDASAMESPAFEVHIAPDGGLTLTGFPPDHVALMGSRRMRP